MTLTSVDIDHIFQRLREGVVPSRGLDAFAVGVDKPLREFERLFGLLSQGEGVAKFLRGDYGCGKTFMAQLAAIEAQRAGFATSMVVVSDSDLHLYRFQDLYRRVLAELSTDACPKGALTDILDRWVGAVEEGLIAAGADEDAEDFDERVAARLKEDLQVKMGGKAPADFVRTIQTIFELKQAGELDQANALLSWLSGSQNVAHSVKKLAQVKGEIDATMALTWLHGVLEIVKAAGYRGLVIIVDEVETILRSRKDTRHKSLNGLRQIIDGASGFHGLMWIFTGTVEFFDDRRGVKGLAPLYDRIRFIEQDGYASLRQPQMRLEPFDGERLRGVALRLRDLYPASDRERFLRTVTEGFVDRFVDSFLTGFAKKVGVVPREFLREFVTRCDIVEEDPDYPLSDDFPDTEALVAEVKGDPPPEESGDDLVPVSDVW